MKSAKDGWDGKRVGGGEPKHVCKLIVNDGQKEKEWGKEGVGGVELEWRRTMI